MGYIARLRKGALIFDLDGSNGVGLMDDFEPPNAQLSNNITTGTGSNFYGGGEFISRKAFPLSFSFTVRSLAGSNALAEQQVDRLANFLAMAGDKRDPVWFEFRPDNNVSFEPLWGQRGAFRRVEVLALEYLTKIEYASSGLARQRSVKAAVSMTVNMPVQGNRQRTCIAGALLEDWMGTRDGISRGIIVPESTTNLIHNPIFGHTNYSNGWTAAAGLIMSKNIDPEFVLFGNVSVKIIATATARFTCAPGAAAAKHSMELYCKRPDGAAISAADCACYYGGAQATTYTSIGNGWYRVGAVNFDGIAAATDTGLTILAGATLYISGAMLIQKVYNVPMCHGDILDHAWSVVASPHDSHSSTTGGYCALPVSDSTFNYGQWTIRVVWKAERTITGVAKWFLQDSTPNLAFTFTAADKWSLTDGTNTALSAALSCVAGTTYTFHLVASLAGGLVVYLNGASIATNATYTPPANPTYIYIGSDSGTANQPNGTFKGLTTYDRSMTSTEVLADYNNLLPMITADKRVDWIAYNSSGSVYNRPGLGHTFVVGSVPGDVQAETQFKITPSQSFAKTLWLGHHVDGYNYYVNSMNRFIANGTGTVTAATDYNSDVVTIDLPTAVPRTSVTRVVNFPDRIHGTFHFFVRMRSSANTHTVSVGYYLIYNGGYVNCLSDKTVSVNTTSKWYYLGKLSLEPAKMIDPGEMILSVGMNFSCASAADDLLVDYGEVINGDICNIVQYASDAPGGGGAASYPSYVVVNGKSAFFDSAANPPTNNRLAKFRGSVIDMWPEVSNEVTPHFADDAGADVVADAVVITYLDITPRWITE